MSVVSFAQNNITIKGSVVDDSDGLGIPGVTILDNNKKVLGITNDKGVYNISTFKGVIVRFSIIGYGTVTKTFNEAKMV